MQTFIIIYIALYIFGALGLIKAYKDLRQNKIDDYGIAKDLNRILDTGILNLIPQYPLLALGIFGASLILIPIVAIPIFFYEVYVFLFVRNS